MVSPVVWSVLSDKTLPKVMGYIQSVIGIHGADVWKKINTKMNNSTNTSDRICWELSNQQIFFTKQIPKKPIFDYNLSDTLSKFHCECGKTIKVNHDVGIMDDNDAPNYCSDCGQKLDWSEESEENNGID